MNSATFWDWVTDRWYEFRVGDGTYLRFIPSFLQFIIVTYTLYLAELTSLFPSIVIFGLTFIAIYTPLAMLFGRFIHRKRQLRKDLMIGSTENPLSAWINRTSYEQLIRMCNHLKIPISKEYLQAYEFWKNLDEKLGYKP